MDLPSLSMGVPPLSCTGIGVFFLLLFLSNFPFFGPNFLSGEFAFFFGAGVAGDAAGLSATAFRGLGMSSHITDGIFNTSFTCWSNGSSPDGPKGRPALVSSANFKCISLSAADS